MKKKNKSFGEAVAVGSALAGAALGAAAVMFSDKKNQEKIKKTIDGISREAVVIGKNIKKKAAEFTKSTQKNEKQMEKTVKKVIKKEAVKPSVKKNIKKKIATKSVPSTKK